MDWMSEKNPKARVGLERQMRQRVKDAKGKLDHVAITAGRVGWGAENREGELLYVSFILYATESGCLLNNAEIHQSHIAEISSKRKVFCVD